MLSLFCLWAMCLPFCCCNTSIMVLQDLAYCSPAGKGPTGPVQQFAFPSNTTDVTINKLWQVEEAGSSILILKTAYILLSSVCLSYFYKNGGLINLKPIMSEFAIRDFWVCYQIISCETMTRYSNCMNVSVRMMEKIWRALRICRFCTIQKIILLYTFEIPITFVFDQR